MNKKKIVIPLVVVLLVAAVAFGIARRNRKDPNVIRVSGNIETVDVELSFSVGGRVQSRLATEGAPITAGSVVARIDPTDLHHEVALREAELEAARSKLAELQAGSRAEEVGQAAAAFRQAQAEEERAASEYARARQLYGGDVISKRELETAEAIHQTARERSRQAGETLALVRKGPRAETIEQARARGEQAAEAVAAARTRLGYATLTTPVGGVVIAEHVEAGEQVAPGTPIVTVGDLHHPWLRAYIDETDLGRIRLGQRVRVTTDTFPDKAYAGVITFISPEAEFTPKTVQTEKERVKLVYRIKIDVANPQLELKPGMPADATIGVVPR